LNTVHCPIRKEKKILLLSCTEFFGNRCVGKIGISGADEDTIIMDCYIIKPVIFAWKKISSKKATLKRNSQHQNDRTVSSSLISTCKLNRRVRLKRFRSFTNATILSNPANILLTRKVEKKLLLFSSLSPQWTTETNRIQR